MAYARQQLIDLVRATANAYGIDEGIAVAQIQAESKFNPRAVSSAGAQGLAQFMPGTWATWGRGGDPFNPDDAMPAWGDYMTYLLNRFGWNYGYALAAYNWGENRQALNDAYNAGRSVESVNLPAETREYLAKILPNFAGSTDIAPDPNGQTVSGWFQYFPFIIFGAIIWWAVIDD